MSSSLTWSENIKTIADKKDLLYLLSNTNEKENLQRLIENRDRNVKVTNDDINNLCIILNSLTSSIVLPNNKVIDECNSHMKMLEDNNLKMSSAIEADLKYIKNIQMKSNNSSSSTVMIEKETNTELDISNCFVWVKDGIVSKCTLCNADFTMFNRKHHCRSCGKIFCSSCSSNKASIKGYTVKVRVCNECFQHMQGIANVNS